VFAFIILSLVPHQEMRFLLPMLVPLVLLGYKGIFGSESFWWLKIVWIVFNVVLLIFLGLFHQGGVVPVIQTLSSQPVGPDATQHIIFYHTYMPPEHLFAIEPSSKPRNVIYDLMGAELTELRRKLQSVREQPSYRSNDKIYVVAPATIDLGELSTCLVLENRKWFHWSGENPPDNILQINKLFLNMYAYDTSVPLPRSEQPISEGVTHT